MTSETDNSKHESTSDANKQSTVDLPLSPHTDTDRLNQVFDISSEKNRNFLFSFLAAELYVLIAVGSTTDLNLLLAKSSFSLPVVNVTIPIVGFYIFAPLLLLVFHANLLFNLSEHVDLLNKWQSDRKNSQNRFPYLINVLAYYRDKGEKSFKSIVVEIIAIFAIILLPLFIFLFIQIRFSDYHHIYISSLHVIIFITDLYFLYKYITLLPIQLFPFVKNPKILSLFMLPVSISIANILIVGVILIAPSKMDTKKWNVPIFDLKNYDSELFVHRWKDRWNGIVLSPEIRIQLKDLLIPHLDLHEYKISKIKEELKNTYSLETQVKVNNDSLKLGDIYHREDLQDRDLQFANFNRATLFNVDFRDTSLAGAFLEDTMLQSANLKGTKLPGAYLKGANLQNVNLYRAKLMNVDLSDANLIGTNLESSELRGANLTDADLKSANLTDAGLTDTYLVRADMTSANLEGANLTGANLTGANLTGASLESAFLTDANLDSADLEKVNLRFTDLREARLIGATLEGATMLSAKLMGADLTRAKLMGADLTGADLTNANLTKAHMFKINLYNADLTGANLTDTDLRDADLRITKLITTILKNADLTDASLRSADLTGADLTNAYISQKQLNVACGSKDTTLPNMLSVNPCPQDQ